MTVIPGTYKLRIPQRADLEIEVTLPLDCTNKTVAAEVWNERRSRLLLSLTVEWIDRPNGVLRLKAPWDETRLVKSEGQWDLLVVDDITGERDYYLEGSTSLDLGYTEVAP